MDMPVVHTRIPWGEAFWAKSQFYVLLLIHSLPSFKVFP